MVATPKDKSKDGKKHSKKREKKESKKKDESQMSALHPPAAGGKKDESQRSALKPPSVEAQKTWARSPMPEAKHEAKPEAKPEGNPKGQLPNCITCFPDVITYQPENKKQVRNLEIKNKGDRPVMFKLKSTSPGLYRMRPIYFMLRPAESKIIKLSYKGCADGQAPNLKDRFTVVMAYPPGVESNVKLMWTQKAYVEKLADCTHRKYVKVFFDGYDVPDKSKVAEPEPEPAAPPPPPPPPAAPAAPAAAPSPPPQQPQQPGGFPGLPGMPGGGGGIVYVIYQGDQNKPPAGGGGAEKKKEKEEEDEKDEKEGEGDDEEDEDEDDKKKK